MIVIEGGDELARVAAELRSAASDLSREMSQDIAKSMQPLTRTIPASALATLPTSGGLAARVARSPIRVVRRGNGARLQIGGSFNLQQLDRGSVTHPTYGHRPSVTQAVTPGFFSKPVKAAEPRMRADADKSLQRAADKVK